MDAHLFRLYVSRLMPLLENGRLEKFQEPVPGLLTISFFGGGRKWRLYLRYNRRTPFLFLNDDRLAAPERPSGAIMRMRRYFGDRRIAAIVPQFFARKLWLLAADAPNVPKGTLAWLCLDLALGPSIHFLKPEEEPEEEAAAWPEPPMPVETLADWKSWPILTPALRRTLSTLEDLDKWALIQDLRSGEGDAYLYRDNAGAIKKISAWPLPAALAENLIQEETSDIPEAVSHAGMDIVLAKIHAEKSARIYAPGQRRINQLKKTLEKLAADADKLNRMADREQDAIAIQANLWHLPRDMRTDVLELASGTGMLRIPLDRRFSLVENMKRMFHQAGRGKRGLAMLKSRRQAIEAELAALSASPQPSRENAAITEETVKEGKLEALSRILPKNVQAFLSSDGYLLLRGKDSRGNRAMRRFASPRDLWAHVENGPGAHVIIRRDNPNQEVPARTLEEAGGLAASKSWLSASATASITYAELRHIKPARNGPPGKVIMDKVQFTLVVPVSQKLEDKGVSGKA